MLHAWTHKIGHPGELVATGTCCACLLMLASSCCMHAGGWQNEQRSARITHGTVYDMVVPDAPLHAGGMVSAGVAPHTYI
jgi:hypothetical protein